MATKPASRPIEFDGLRQFLVGVGFVETGTVEGTLVLTHPDSGAIVTLTIPKDNRTVRPADLLSVLTRLEGRGIVEETALESFRAGEMPLAF